MANEFKIKNGIKFQDNTIQTTAYLGGTVRSTQSFTATSGQTVFSFTYTAGLLDVYLNGAKLLLNDDFTASNGTSFTLATGAVAGDIIEAVAYSVNVVADTVTLSTAQTVAGKKTFSSAIIENRVALGSISGSNTLDLNLGNVYTATITGNTTFAVSNPPASGSSVSFNLELTNAGAYTITWWTGVKWTGGTAPTLTASGRDVLAFFTHDGGTTWSGFILGKDVK